jgi:hypothetical protein
LPCASLPTSSLNGGPEGAIVLQRNTTAGMLRGPWPTSHRAWRTPSKDHRHPYVITDPCDLVLVCPAKSGDTIGVTDNNHP